MEEALKTRLDKVYFETQTFNEYPTHVLDVTLATLDAIRAHIQELHPAAIGDILPLEEALEVIKDYR